MSNASIVIILIVLVAVVIFVYGIMPRISSQNPNTGSWVRLMIFTFIAAYLGWDFYSKQKYGYIFVLILGSVAFYIAILNDIKRKKK
jgi:hypothetical protein